MDLVMMDLPLPLEQLRFNIVLLILITAYGISGIGNLFAFVPGWSEEDAEILGCNYHSNYSFWLISSIIFFLLGISLFHYPILIYISVVETYLIIILYLILIIKKWKFLRKNKNKIKKINKIKFG